MAADDTSRASSSRRSRSATSAQTPRLPLVPCPHHSDLRVVQRVSKTSRNPDRTFYRCPKDEKLPTQCTFFLWEEEYVDYLVDKGFLAEFDYLGYRHAAAAAGGGPNVPSHTMIVSRPPPVVPAGIETLMKVQQLQEEVQNLREQMAVMKQQAFHVRLFGLAVIVALVLWK